MEFNVHIFLNHDSYFASCFLPNLYAKFPKSAWEFPPHGDLSQAPGVEPRDVIGRYILPTPVSSNTKLKDIFTLFSDTFNISQDLLAQFTLFRQYGRYLPETGYIPCRWGNHPLPWNMTLSDARKEDIDLGEIEPHNNETHAGPLNVHLVLWTKAAALARIVDSNFFTSIFGEHFTWTTTEHSNTATSYNNQFLRCPGLPELTQELMKWRHAVHALRYLKEQRTQMVGDEKDVTEMEENIERMNTNRIEANIRIWNFGNQWYNWVLSSKGKSSRTAFQFSAQKIMDDESFHDQIFTDDHYVLDDDMVDGETLADGDVEAKVEEIWRSKEAIVDHWRDSKNAIEIRERLEKILIDRQFGGDRAAYDANERKKAENLKKYQSSDRELDSYYGKDLSSNRLSLESLVTTTSFRDKDEVTLTKDSKFVVSSGSLLWGHILPIYYGSTQEAFTNDAAFTPDELLGGTIRQHRYTYKSAARNGDWKVRRYYSSCGSNGGAHSEPHQLAGWVMCHESFDPMEVLRRVRAINPDDRAISNGNRHLDKGVLFIGRYDWSYHWRGPSPDFAQTFQTYAEPAIGAFPEDHDPYVKVNAQQARYFMALDSKGWGLDFLRSFKEECEPAARPAEKVFVKDKTNFGAYVACPGTEYEFGWLVFSGKKHDDHEADELIGIVYDGSYEVLEGPRHAVEPDPV